MNFFAAFSRVILLQSGYGVSEKQKSVVRNVDLNLIILQPALKI